MPESFMISINFSIIGIIDEIEHCHRANHCLGLIFRGLSARFLRHPEGCHHHQDQAFFIRSLLNSCFYPCRPSSCQFHSSSLSGLVLTCTAWHRLSSSFCSVLRVPPVLLRPCWRLLMDTIFLPEWIIELANSSLRPGPVEGLTERAMCHCVGLPVLFSFGFAAHRGYRWIAPGSRWRHRRVSESSEAHHCQGRCGWK